MEEKKTFAEALKAAREEVGMTQHQMSMEGSIPELLIEEWEAGKSIPTERVQHILLEWLEIKKH